MGSFVHIWQGKGKPIGYRQWVVHNELVPVYETSTGEKVVDGRELYNVLQSKQDFSTWVKKRLKECDAEENIDYDRFHEKMEAKNATMIEYIIKLDIAKEMAMFEQNQKGKEVRQYFIKFLGICQEKACCHMNGYTGMDKRTFSNTYKTI